MSIDEKQSYFISGVLEQHFSTRKIAVHLNVARWQLLPTSNLQRKHEFATDKV